MRQRQKVEHRKRVFLLIVNEIGKNLQQIERILRFCCSYQFVISGSLQSFAKVVLYLCLVVVAVAVVILSFRLIRKLLINDVNATTRQKNSVFRNYSNGNAVGK